MSEELRNAEYSLEAYSRGVEELVLDLGDESGSYVRWTPTLSVEEALGAVLEAKDRFRAERIFRIDGLISDEGLQSFKAEESKTGFEEFGSRDSLLDNAKDTNRALEQIERLSSERQMIEQEADRSYESMRSQPLTAASPCVPRGGVNRHELSSDEVKGTAVYEVSAEFNLPYDLTVANLDPVMWDCNEYFLETYPVRVASLAQGSCLPGGRQPAGTGYCEIEPIDDTWATDSTSGPYLFERVLATGLIVENAIEITSHELDENHLLINYKLQDSFMTPPLGVDQGFLELTRLDDGCRLRVRKEVGAFSGPNPQQAIPFLAFNLQVWLDATLTQNVCCSRNFV